MSEWLRRVGAGTRGCESSRLTTCVFWGAVVVAGVLLGRLLVGTGSLAFLVHYPDSWTIPASAWINAFFNWLLHQLSFGLFTFKDAMRGIAAVFNFPLRVLFALLVHGFGFSIGTFAVAFPPLSWLGVLGVLVLSAYRVGRLRLAVLVGCTTLYAAVFGLWDSAMITLSSVLLAVPISAFGGVLIGICGYRNRHVQAALTPVLDLMQTVPIFAYLVPVLVLFGFGPASALLATVIYAMPPMVRVTLLALNSVPEDIREYGDISGATRRQKMWKVLLPSARYQLLIGINQVIILTLNMVIIASMIGAGGLGYDVLFALRQLNIGVSVQAGIAISLMAIAMDRFAQALSTQAPSSKQAMRKHGFARRHRPLLVGVAVLVGTTVLGFFVPALASYPQSATVTTAPYWDAGISWLNINFGAAFYAIKAWALIVAMIPVKRFLLDVPWVIVVAVLGMLGLRLGGRKLALAVTGYVVFILLTGNWDAAITSVYLTVFAVFLSIVIGIPVGIVASKSESAHHVTQVIVDVLQTLPSFVYLIPAVIFFQSGDFSGLLAIVAFAVAPAIRYTDHGIRGVSPQVMESVRVSGGSALQILTKVQLPLALPEIMLGINQTIMMALSMLVIAALIGTSGLGQEIYMALTQADTGRGLGAGISIACIAMVADRLIQVTAKKRQQRLGLV